MFMQIRGKVFWQCPACLTINKHTLRPLRYRVKCVNTACSRTWTMGMVLFSSLGGPLSPPPDLIPVDGGIWRGGRIHKVLCDSCSRIIAEHHPPPEGPWIPLKEAELKHGGFAAPAKEEDEDGLP
jgi:hypothetical protein